LVTEQELDAALDTALENPESAPEISDQQLDEQATVAEITGNSDQQQKILDLQEIRKKAEQEKLTDQEEALRQARELAA
jgi:hypothetical protein